MEMIHQSPMAWYEFMCIPEIHGPMQEGKRRSLIGWYESSCILEFRSSVPKWIHHNLTEWYEPHPYHLPARRLS